MDKSGWAVVACRSSIEETAETCLRKAGYRVYLPRIRVALTGHRSPRGRGEVVLRPMLGGYLFAWLDLGRHLELDPAARWRHWRAPWDRRRAYVSDDAIAILRAAEADDGRKAAAVPRRPEIGETVSTEIAGAHISGVVVQLRGPDRVIVETLLGRQIEISGRRLSGA